MSYSARPLSETGSVQPRTYTPKEVVTVLNRRGMPDDHDRLLRHIRHWTSMDLLVTVGDKHVGTGRAREYAKEEIYRAAVLVELAKWRVPMTVLSETFREFALNHEEDWRLAVEGADSVYMTMSWSEGLTVWNIREGQPALYMLESPTPEKDFREPGSAIVINLSRVLRGLRF